jgi:hypothetical protein
LRVVGAGLAPVGVSADVAPAPLALVNVEVVAARIPSGAGANALAGGRVAVVPSCASEEARAANRSPAFVGRSPSCAVGRADTGTAATGAVTGGFVTLGSAGTGTFGIRFGTIGVWARTLGEPPLTEFAVATAPAIPTGPVSVAGVGVGVAVWAADV